MTRTEMLVTALLMTVAIGCVVLLAFGGAAVIAAIKLVVLFLMFGIMAAE